MLWHIVCSTWTVGRRFGPPKHFGVAPSVIHYHCISCVTVVFDCLSTYTCSALLFILLHVGKKCSRCFFWKLNCSPFLYKIKHIASCAWMKLVNCMISGNLVVIDYIYCIPSYFLLLFFFVSVFSSFSVKVLVLLSCISMHISFTSFCMKIVF